MTLNLPRKVRATIYVLVTIGTAIIVPLEALAMLPVWALPVWTSVAGAASGLAAFNVTPEE